MKHYNIPIFVPHLGCPNDCTFCNQKQITGVDTEVNADDVERIIEAHLATIEDGNIEVAFFGGSFTGIEIEKQEELLNVVQKHINSGRVNGIRVSTRPDYIDEKRLEVLKKYGVTAIELGVQSMDEAVLMLNKRGHTIADVVTATKLVRKFGFELGHQMMTGMYGSNYQKDVHTAQEIIKLKPDTIRIYPTMVLKGTELERLYPQRYTPPTLEQTVQICKSLMLLFEGANIRIIRLGLQSTDTLTTGGEIIAGPYHSAFGQLVESAIMRDIIDEKLAKIKLLTDKVIIQVHQKKISSAIGQKRSNVNYFKRKYELKGFKVMGNSQIKGRNAIISPLI